MWGQTTNLYFSTISSDAGATVSESDTESEYSDNQASHEDPPSLGLNSDQLSELRTHIHPMQPSIIWGIDLYARALEIVLQNE